MLVEAINGATLNWSAISTIGAATIGLLGLLEQQRRHWRETRRDKVREAYADWMSALARVRRTEERLLIAGIEMHATVVARAAAGDRLAQDGGLALDTQETLALQTIERDIENGKRELDVAFGKVCLLDRDWRRIKAAERVRDLETMPEPFPGQPPSEETFNRNWVAKSKALGELADLINRTLELEGMPPFMWDAAERSLDVRQEELHARVLLHRRGTPRTGSGLRAK